ncbi:hypothetical protein JVT61DRAFT_12270 [Boletus reticuloceps]|uniref:Uncharacterized protein n=1 Tax=Boletus reticuloceps TaxID=495285 RepID=A0A8I2YEG7_9AGAM|nr:hypothetical protein JVT61DRAFT_12270 [Boletus reticuloceps]
MDTKQKSPRAPSPLLRSPVHAAVAPPDLTASAANLELIPMRDMVPTPRHRSRRIDQLARERDDAPTPRSTERDTVRLVTQNRLRRACSRSPCKTPAGI